MREGGIREWSPAGDGAPRDAPARPVSVLTPRAIAAAGAVAGGGADASARVASRFSVAATIAIKTMMSTRVPTTDVSAAGTRT